MARRLQPQVLAELLDRLKFVLFDIDGVLWSGENVFRHARETISYLKQQGKQVRFISNNAANSRADLLEKFHKRGFNDVCQSEIYNSGHAAALYLQRTAESSGSAKYSQNVFVIGSKGLHEELKSALSERSFTYGLELNIGSEPHGSAFNATKYDEDKLVKFVNGGLPPPTSFGPSAESFQFSLTGMNFGAVVVGLDPNATLSKLAIACLCIQEGKRRGKKVQFIATNRDPQYPVGEYLMPGAGTMVGYIETTCNQAPDAVCGKPDTLLFDILAKREGITDLSSVLMVGDRLTTDIAFGLACGIHTMFVLTGCETTDDIAKTDIHPTFTAEGVWELLPSDVPVPATPLYVPLTPVAQESDGVFEEVGMTSQPLHAPQRLFEPVARTSPEIVPIPWCSKIELPERARRMTGHLRFGVLFRNPHRKFEKLFFTGKFTFYEETLERAIGMFPNLTAVTKALESVDDLVAVKENIIVFDMIRGDITANHFAFVKSLVQSQGAVDAEAFRSAVASSAGLPAPSSSLPDGGIIDDCPPPTQPIGIPSVAARKRYATMAPGQGAFRRGLTCKMVDGKHYFCDHIRRTAVPADPDAYARQIEAEFAAGLQAVWDAPPHLYSMPQLLALVDQPPDSPAYSSSHSSTSYSTRTSSSSSRSPSYSRRSRSPVRRRNRKRGRSSSREHSRGRRPRGRRSPSRSPPTPLRPPSSNDSQTEFERLGF